MEPPDSISFNLYVHISFQCVKIKRYRLECAPHELQIHFSIRWLDECIQSRLLPQAETIEYTSTVTLDFQYVIGFWVEMLWLAFARTVCFHWCNRSVWKVTPRDWPTETLYNFPSDRWTESKCAMVSLFLYLYHHRINTIQFRAVCFGESYANEYMEELLQNDDKQQWHSAHWRHNSRKSDFVFSIKFQFVN